MDEFNYIKSKDFWSMKDTTVKDERKMRVKVICSFQNQQEISAIFKEVPQIKRRQP